MCVLNIQTCTDDLRYLEIYEDFQVVDNGEDEWLVTGKDRDFNLRIVIAKLPSKPLAVLVCNSITQCCTLFNSDTVSQQ